MLEAYGVTDPGCVRQKNQDYFLIEPDLGLYLVADGMGGAQGGEHASKLAAETVLEVVRETGKADDTLLSRAFEEANLRVLQAASTDSTLKGMGTTLVAVLENREKLEIASVGDSRCYHFVDNTVTLVTVDQTWVQEIGKRLGIDDEQLKKHPMRHVLTMAIGASKSLRIHSPSLPRRPGEQILLCSDGLHGVVSQEIIAEALSSERSLESKCHYLIEAARNAGGPDNITVVLLRTADTE